MLFVPLQFSVYPGPQTTSLSTQMHHMEDLVQFLSTLREGEERPIEFFNKQLSSAERNYAASEIMPSSGQRHQQFCSPPSWTFLHSCN